MTHTELYKEIQAGRVRPAYLFYGEEPFVLESAIGWLRKALLREGFESMDEARFDYGIAEARVSASDAIFAAETLPTFAERRLILLIDLPGFTSAKAREADVIEGEKIAEWLDKSPETACVVFRFRGMPHTGKRLFKALSSHALAVNFAPLTPAELMKWMGQTLRADRKRIDADAADMLIKTCGKSLQTLKCELEKLSAYVGDRETVEARDVAAIASSNPEWKVFEIVEECLSQRPLRARIVADALVDRGERIAGIVALIGGQVRNLAVASGASIASQAALSSRYGIFGGAADAAARWSRRIDAEAARRAFSACVDVESAIKGGKLRDEAGLDRLMWIIQELGGSKLPPKPASGARGNSAG